MYDGSARDEADDDDPAIAGVRRELAHLGRDEASAPPVPDAVTTQIGSALRAADHPAHQIDRPRLRTWPVVGLVVGLGAVVIGVIVGTSALGREPGPRLSSGPTASMITVRPTFPVPEPEVVALLSTTPYYGPLSDPNQRAGCLTGLGHRPDTEVLGARPLTVDGATRVLVLLPGETADTVVALLIEPNCSRAHPGLVADTVVRRP